MSSRNRRSLAFALAVLLIGIILALTFTLPQLSLDNDDQNHLESGRHRAATRSIDTSAATTSSFIRVAFVMLVILGVAIPILLVWERKGWRRAIITIGILALLLFWLNKLNQKAVDMPKEPTARWRSRRVSTLRCPLNRRGYPKKALIQNGQSGLSSDIYRVGAARGSIRWRLDLAVFNSRQQGDIHPEMEGLSGQIDEALRASGVARISARPSSAATLICLPCWQKLASSNARKL